MSVYSPTNVALIEEVERFYDDLRTAIHHVPAHNFLIILGDFNARLGPEDAPFTYHTNTNRNGEHLAALLTEHELLAANTLFRKRMGKRWTFQDRATSMRRQLDYILVRRKWRKSILNAESYSTFDSLGSDHRVVAARLRLSLRVPKSAPRARPDWEAFAEALNSRPTTQRSEEATRKWVPTKGRHRASPRSKHPEVVRARTRVEEARRSFEREGTAESQEELNGAKQQLFGTYDRIKGEELMEKVKKVETVHGERRYKESWKVINEMSGRKRSREGQLAGCSPEERVTSWFTHFRDLLGTHPTVDGAEEEIPAVLTNLEIDDGPFTATEFATVKSTLKEGKVLDRTVSPRGP
ncbi:hypothetical protein AAFF_G00431720 [Aldrovandia affinis]|uniref:Endonuclease/exonuclease/phosphatase domain-containing protein n=1 Tax=Aldrovandia affinis TaxID=143900 RepID=A0AAD7S8U8_9TELE|nr:hypothetical protein AAFF_G00431720 [Aldrovandia affinis]